jgi:hypothetical protein
MSRLEITLSILKFAGIALSALFGAIALVTDYRDKDTGKITKWGRRALLGVIASSLVVAFIQIGEMLEHSYDRAGAERLGLEQLQRNEKILNQINRGLNPLTDVRLSIRFKEIRMDHPLLSAYVRRLERGAAMLSFTWKLNPRFTVRGTMPSWDRSPDGALTKVNSVTIRKNSPLFPSKRKETAAYDLLNPVNDQLPIMIDFLKTPIRFSNYPIYHLPDVSMSFEEDSRNLGSFEVTYSLSERTFTMLANELITDSKKWASSGKITSFIDLAGVQMLMDVPSAEPEEFRPELDDIRIWVGSRQFLFLTGDMFKRHPYERGTVYDYVFPDDLNELLIIDSNSPVKVDFKPY